MRPQDDDLVAGLVELGEAIVAHDTPWAHPATVTGMRGMLRAGWDGEPPEMYAGVQSGRVVGSAAIWTSTYDNLTSAWLDVGVHPGHRRAGLGGRLLTVAHARSLQLGRPLVALSGWASPAATGFATAHGYQFKLTDVVRRQQVGDLPADLEARVAEVGQRHAAAYELVEVAMPMPEELAEGVSAMWGGINDAPLDDLEMEEEVFPLERVRAYEQAQLACGHRLHQVLARHRGTGEIVGHTIVAVEVERPWIGEQHDTAVARQHRGHRLGWLLKAQMLLLLAREEPELRTIDTDNAESNAHVVAINEQLGYRVLGRVLNYQARLPMEPPEHADPAAARVIPGFRGDPENPGFTPVGNRGEARVSRVKRELAARPVTG